ncbi:MAG: type III-A CRISPR-associated protein Cas10/Csm1 [Candidatus Helarchaeota archaeon]
MTLNETITIGGLLHDIGKFVQRSASNPTSMRHQEFGADYLKSIEYDPIYSLISRRHHKLRSGDEKFYELDAFNIPSKNLLEKNINIIIYEADNLSSSEREEIDRSFRANQALISIFSKIAATNETKVVENRELMEKRLYYVNSPLNAQSFFIPREKDDIKYEPTIRNELTNQLRKIKDNLTPNNLEIVLEKYLSLVPAVTSQNGADISLFDHLKTTAAIGSCMLQYLIGLGLDLEKEDLSKQVLDKKDDKYLLIEGDFSGIQDFIYTIASKHALRLLRGRSFFLELVMQDIIDEILHRMGLHHVNVVFAGGGHFYILAPNLEKNKEIINKIRNEVNEWLLEQFKGALYLAIDHVEFSGERFLREKFMDVWKDISMKIRVQKAQRFKSVLIKDPIRLLLETDHENKVLCDYCKSSTYHDQLKILDERDDELRGCSLCFTFFKIGSLLPDARYIIKTKSVLENNINLIFGNYNLIRKNKLNQVLDEVQKLFNLNSFELPLEVIEKGIDINTFLLGNHFKSKGLDETKESAFGVKKIGILRMDVDNLGKIILQGLPESNRTLSRVSTLSRFLNLFFKNFLNVICQRNDGLAEKSCQNNPRIHDAQPRDVAIVYSGGDDLFIIGAWSEVFELAFDIESCFKNYTCNNPQITISAGLAIVGAKYPIHKAAIKAGEYESKAKKGEKNKIMIFEKKNSEFESVNWDLMRKLWNVFGKDLIMIKRDELKVETYLSHSFLQNVKLILMKRQDTLFKNPNLDKNQVDLRSLYLILYLFGRNKKKKASINEEVIYKKFLNNVLRLDYIHHVDIIIRIIQLLSRGD